MPKSQYMDPSVLRAPGKITFQDIPMNVYNKTISEELAEGNFTKDDLKRIFRDMTVCREFENMLFNIKTQGTYAGVTYTYPGPSHLSIGQEATAVGEAYMLDKDDFTFGSHRSHSEILAKGLSAIEKLSDEELDKIMKDFLGGATLKVVDEHCKTTTMKDKAIHFLVYGAMAEIFARETGFHKGLGGSMHAFFQPFGIYPNNAIVGGSAPTATGAALYKKENYKKGVVVANAGDGSIGCGPVWESMNFAAMDQYNDLWEEGKKGGLPIIFHFNNNSYGMGGQTHGETMAYGEVARIGSGITPTQMHAERVDGYNPLAVIDAYRRKKPMAENGQGPILLDVITYRLGGHSTSDQQAYRTKEEVAAWQEIDPLTTYPKALIDAGVATQEEIDAIWAETKKLIGDICHIAADPAISPYVDMKAKDKYLVEDLMFSNQKVKSFDAREPEVLGPKESCSRSQSIATKERFGIKDGKPVSKMKVFNYRDALYEAIMDKYYEDPTLIVYGEDVREWGGAFAVYRGMHEVIPYSRLFNSPISEAAIVGTAVGYAMSGGRALVELMYTDFMGRCGDEIFNQMAKWQAMSAGILKMPVVLRLPNGSKYAAQHSQDWVAMAAHVPGLKVYFPATPYEAKGLMNLALNGTDPVCFFESQRLYDTGELYHEGGVPDGYYELKEGDLDVIKEGKDLTILTMGATLYRVMDAVKELEGKYGLSCEVMNICSVVPLNYDQIIASVKKTGKVLLASDACVRGSFMNDIARNITNLCFDDLDAPPVVVGAKNWITPPFEFDEFFFPQPSWILDAVNDAIVPLSGYENVQSYTPVEEIRAAKKGV